MKNNQRLLRRILVLQEYNIDIIYIKGKYMIIPDVKNLNVTFNMIEVLKCNVRLYMSSFVLIIYVHTICKRKLYCINLSFLGRGKCYV